MVVLRLTLRSDVGCRWGWLAVEIKLTIHFPNLPPSNNKTVLLNTCNPSDIPWKIQTRLSNYLKVLEELKGRWEGGGGGVHNI